MDIIKGRESGVVEPRLCLMIGKISKYIGEAGSVPKSVSRKHCCLTIDDNKNLTINNISEQNTVYINGVEYKSKSISSKDLIELGVEKYRLDIFQILNFITNLKGHTDSNCRQKYEITHLRNIWNNYTKSKLDIQIRERKINALSAVPGIISMISIAISFIEGMREIFITIAVIFALAFILIRIKNAGNVPLLQKELDEKFQDNYICPHCMHFLGNQRYDLILRNGGCPWCKSKFVE